MFPHRIKTWILCVVMGCSVWLIPTRSHARLLGLQFGVGNWYSDSFKTSYLWGGGVLLHPGVQWLNFSATWERAKIKADPNNPLYVHVHQKWFDMVHIALQFPTPILFGKLKCLLYPSMGYLLSFSGDSKTHGFGVGGGLELLLWKENVGLRAEVRDQFYQVPFSGGHSDQQNDLIFMAKLVLAI